MGQIISQEKKAELYFLEEVDLEGMKGMLSNQAVSKAFLSWGSKTTCNLTGMVRLRLFPHIQPGLAEVAPSLSRAGVELHVKGSSYPGQC